MNHQEIRIRIDGTLGAAGTEAMQEAAEVAARAVTEYHESRGLRGQILQVTYSTGNPKAPTVERLELEGINKPKDVETQDAIDEPESFYRSIDFGEGNATTSSKQRFTRGGLELKTKAELEDMVAEAGIPVYGTGAGGAVLKTNLIEALMGTNNEDMDLAGATGSAHG